MKNLKLYCPKCGNELTSCIKGHMLLYKCPNQDCTYANHISENTIDISFKSKGIAKALSNLCSYPFVFDNVHCASMESFIQSLKVKDIYVQQDVCSKTGPFCYSIREMFDDWRETQTIYWQGNPICRHSTDYILLLKRAYKALLAHSSIFYYALKQVKENNYTLIHTIGCTDPSETLLTPNEFISILNDLISNYLN